MQTVRNFCATVGIPAPSARMENRRRIYQRTIYQEVIEALACKYAKEIIGKQCTQDEAIAKTDCILQGIHDMMRPEFHYLLTDAFKIAREKAKDGI
jgi:hypothetical protein